MTSFHYMELFKQPSPCDDCSKFEVCKCELKACKQFLHYVNSGRIVHGNKLPTREIWLKIFHDDNLEEENEST